MDTRLNDIKKAINDYMEETGLSVGELDDGYHTFNELYEHRAILSALAFNNIPLSWKSLRHYDDNFPMYEGMFIVGSITPDGIITYHYDLTYWDLFKVPELHKALKFDGHTPSDVVERMRNYIQRGGPKLNRKDLERAVNFLRQSACCYNDFERMLVTYGIT